MQPVVRVPSQWRHVGTSRQLTASTPEASCRHATPIKSDFVSPIDGDLVGVQRQDAWDAASLRKLVRQHLLGQQIMVVSNRQPQSHVREQGRVRIEQSAGGLVTALEPVVRACGGTWIAHGSGNADREFVDSSDGWSVDTPAGSYRLRRVWLSAAQQKGHGDGFSNAGL